MWLMELMLLQPQLEKCKWSELNTKILKVFNKLMMKINAFILLKVCCQEGTIASLCLCLFLFSLPLYSLMGLQKLYPSSLLL